VKLATLRTDGSTVAVRIDCDTAVELDGYSDVGALLAAPDWKARASTTGGREHRLDGIQPSSWHVLVPRPSKIICVGLNYRAHILEMGRELPEYPTLFAKFAEALVGPNDPVVLPTIAPGAVDWEGELAVIIGTPARNVSEADASAHIGGYAVLNDVTVRDYQYRTAQWLQGKTFESTTPLGPWMVTPDEYTPTTRLRTVINDEVVQDTLTSDMVFTPAHLVSYISHIITLNPGDVIASGTPAGVGHARTPARYLREGDVLTTTIEGLGTLANPVVRA
jgi:acylpyruvate hydrolase